MFKIITPIAFVVLAVSASEEESIEVTRRMLGEDYNNDGIPDVYQSNYQKGYDIDRNYGHRYDYDKYRPNDDYNNDKGYNKGWSNNDDKNDYGRYGATQGRQDEGNDAPDSTNGLESRYGGYGHGYHNDYYKRDYYHKPYYPRYWANEGGESDNDASRVLGAQDNDEPGDDNRLVLASRYGGGYGRNNGYKRNYNRYNYYNDKHYGPYWANEGGNPDDAGSRLTAMDKEAGDDNALASRHGGYGRNDYYRYDRYYRNKYNDDGYGYWSNQGGEPDETDRDGGLESRYGRYGRNDYYNGDDRYYRNRYNDGYRYWSTQGGEDGKNDREDGYEELASRYGHGNNYYNGWYKQRDDYYSKPNYGQYWATAGGNNDEGNAQDLIDLGQANVILKSDDGVFELSDNNEKDDNEDD